MIMVKNNMCYGVTKEKFVEEFEQLNQQFRKVEQKLSVNIDLEILSRFQQLDNAVTFTMQPLKRIKNQLYYDRHVIQSNHSYIKEESALV